MLHSVAVTIDRVEEMPAKGAGPGRTAVLATVLVERKSQKRILIGKGGAMLKTIGQGARLQMQTLIDGPVYSSVKVVPDWRSALLAWPNWGTARRNLPPMLSLLTRTKSFEDPWPVIAGGTRTGVCIVAGFSSPNSSVVGGVGCDRRPVLRWSGMATW